MRVLLFPLALVVVSFITLWNYEKWIKFGPSMVRVMVTIISVACVTAVLITVAAVN